MILGIDIGQHHLGACVWDPESRTIRQWGIWSSNGSWAKDVYACLDTNATPEFMDGVRNVVIEHQPSKNPTMTRIMHYVEFFFVTKSLIVHIQDSKHKLLYATTTPWFPSHESSTEQEWTYRIRKKLAIQTVSTFLTDTNQAQSCIDTFTSSKKKDDLADSLLHAMAYTSFQKVHGFTNDPKQKPKIMKLVSRPPSAKQERLGRYSPHNIRYFLKPYGTDTEAIDTFLKQHQKIKRYFKKHFPDGVDQYLKLV